MAVDPHALEEAVRNRYSAGAEAREEALCCPVDYDREALSLLPREIVERDYGCGDPSQFVREGEHVLDLGSGGGKICYLAARLTGPTGSVTGVDLNDDMLALARKYQGEMARKLGYANVAFKKGRIQDLALDWDEAERYLAENPVRDAAALERFEGWAAEQRAKRPMIPDGSVDLIVSNCVLNLVREDHKAWLFSEMFRVLRRGGRAAISDIVSDEAVPERLQRDPALWSGCLSGAFEETEFLKAFERAGFYGIEIAKRDERPWRTVEGIEFRSVTVTAYKGKEGPCWEGTQAVIYKGPFSEVRDDDGHRFVRGERAAVCGKTFEILTRAPYAPHFIGIEPYAKPEARIPFGCDGYRTRHPRESKGAGYDATTEAAGSCCAPGSDNESCC